MSNNEKIKKHCLGGQPTKFNKDKHISLLVDVFSRGESIAAFCSEAMISKHTFHDWLKAQPTFKFTYDIVLPIAEKIWESYPVTNSDMNHNYWFLTMKNRFGFCKPKIDVVDDVTPKGRLDAIWKAIEKGDLTTDEISKIANLVVTQVNVENGSIISNSGAMIKETRESLIEKISMISKVIEHVQEEAK